MAATMTTVDAVAMVVVEVVSDGLLKNLRYCATGLVGRIN